MELSTSLTAIPLIKKPMVTRLAKLGLFTVEDLLYHIPSRYEDYSQIVPIDSLAVGDTVSIVGTITHLSSGRSFHKKLLITEATLSDDTSSIRLLWFNQRFVAQSLHEDTEVRISGKVSSDKKGMLLQNPSVEKLEKEAVHTGRLVPVYPETSGVTSKFLRWQIASIMSKLTDFPDPLPAELLKKYHLPTLKQTFVYLHFPKTLEQTDIAKKRLAFQEVLLVQLKAQEIRQAFESQKSQALLPNKTLTQNFLTSLPFTLTPDQKKAIQEIGDDVAKTSPMNRLLNGDVGSGKTVVAAFALLLAASNNTQAVLLAPTEVLARQHYESLKKLFAGTPFEVSLFTRTYHVLHGDQVSRASFTKALAAGIPDIIIGTHALLQDTVSFANLTLVIVDEQHRFGVAQRAKLQALSSQESDQTPDTIPHFLSLTATPIPRTLTLAFFGNLSVSLLTTMPKNRKPIITMLAKNTADRTAVYNHIRKEVAAGHQAFIIFPLVEDSQAMADVKAAVSMHQHLAKDIFPSLAVGLIHGKLKAKEKEAVMLAFKQKEYDVLVATSVIEVGIDIPNATVIAIEEADRFGLSQLHQFRGRVGRGEAQSYCFLLPGKFEHTPKRLEALTKTNSGFELAEVDLAERGPGSFLGTRQSGIPDVAMEHMTNLKLVAIAQKDAAELLKADPKLTQHPLLKAALNRFDERIHLE